jgi:hypothetical protein
MALFSTGLGKISPLFPFLSADINYRIPMTYVFDSGWEREGKGEIDGLAN